jgi:type IV pilus assembly protein PilV
MNRSMISKKEGFSLIEVLIALIFLSIGLLAIASLQITSVRGNVFSHNLMQATYVAQDRLEFLQNVPYDSSQLNQGDYDPDPAGAITISGVVFNRSYKVIDDAAGYKQINYTVTWDDGVQHRISFSTFRSQ